MRRSFNAPASRPQAETVLSPRQTQKRVFSRTFKIIYFRKLGLRIGFEAKFWRKAGLKYGIIGNMGAGGFGSED